MKWIGLLIYIALVPMLIARLRNNPGKAPILWAAVGFIPFILDIFHFKIAPISWSMWPGYVKGAELSLLDPVALAIVLSYPNIRVKSPLMIVLPLYIVVVLSTMAYSGVPEASFFYAWQLGRVMLLFAAAAKISQHEKGPQALITGMILGMCVQAGYAIEQRLTGVMQSSGTFGHQNLLGMISHFVTFPALALLLVDGKRRAPLFGVLAGAIVVILGASRATLGLAGGGIVALLLMSIVRKATSRKSMIVGMGLMALVLAAPLALSSLQSRFDATPLSTDYDERAAFERAAKMAIAAHPMGVGSNQYVVVANTEGYSDRAGVIWNWASRSANVHNTYLLVRAETGPLGLAVFVAFLFAPMIAAFGAAWRNRKEARGDLMLGLGMSFAIVSIHCLYEWVFVNYSVQVMFAIDAGIVAGLAQQISRAKSTKRKRAKLSENLSAMANASETA